MENFDVGNRFFFSWGGAQGLRYRPVGDDSPFIKSSRSLVHLAGRGLWVLEVGIWEKGGENLRERES